MGIIRVAVCGRCSRREDMTGNRGPEALPPNWGRVSFAQFGGNGYMVKLRTEDWCASCAQKLDWLFNLGTTVVEEAKGKGPGPAG